MEIYLENDSVLITIEQINRHMPEYKCYGVEYKYIMTCVSKHTKTECLTFIPRCHRLIPTYIANKIYNRRLRKEALRLVTYNKVLNTSI